VRDNLVLAALACIVMIACDAHAAATADAERLEADVRAISTEYFPRDHLHPENLDRLAAHLSEEFEAAGARVTEQPFEVEGRTYRNVIASFGPEDGDRVVVGAHYDTFGENPGADDNASGVAGLLELARMLGNAKLATRVDLVAYTLEEPPHWETPSMGSAVHAKSLKLDGAKLRGMISLEMIGYFSDIEGSQAYPFSPMKMLYPTKGNFIAVVGNFRSAFLMQKVKTAMVAATPLPVESLAAPSFVVGIDWSDHLNYWKAGYTAVMVTDTAFYRNKSYHTEQDTADRLDFKRMGQVVSGVYAAILELAR
jgi:hypothetical protein